MSVGAGGAHCLVSLGQESAGRLSSVREKVYFLFDFDDILPEWIFNTDCSSSNSMVFIPTDILPPSMLPVGTAGCALRQVGPAEPLVVAALKRKAFFTRAEIDAMLAAEGLALPKGSKKLKRNAHELLLKHYFPNVPDDELLDLLGARKGAEKVSCHEEVLAAVSEMDEDNKNEFADVIKEAKEHVQKIKQKKLEAVMEEKYQAKLDLFEQEHKRRAAAERAADEPGAAEAVPERAADEPGGAGQEADAGAEEAPPPDAEADLPARARAPEAVPRAPVFLHHPVQAPEEFKRLLPHLDFLYFWWEPRHRRARVEFRRASEATQQSFFLHRLLASVGEGY